MRTVHDWKIRTKTAAAFGLVLLVTLGLGLFAEQLLELQLREAGHAAYVSARLWIYVATGLAVVLSGLAGFFMVLSLARPIRDLTLLMNRLATGDLSVTVEGAERRDEVGAMAKAVQVFKDGLLERDRLLAELQRLARLDPLTGALNRRAFREFLEREAARARRHGRPLSLAILDIDHFKHVNDTLGHAMGDTVLVAVAQAVSEVLRTEDLFSRHGGEEFIVVFPETDLTGALQAAERLRLAIAGLRIDADGTALNVTASLGVATFGDLRDDNGASIDNVIDTADQALYQAKAAGRNRVLSYTPGLSSASAA